MSAPAEAGAAPTWQRLAECPRCVLHRPHLKRTLATALIVGTVLFLINHLVQVAQGHASLAVWVSTGLSFVVPFCVANVGVLVAMRRPDPVRAARRRARGRQRRPAPTWSRLAECPRCVAYPPHLARTVATALVVGTAYFIINQLDAVLHGPAGAAVWIPAGVTYLVPFCVSNIGVLVGCRRPSSSAAATADSAAG